MKTRIGSFLLLLSLVTAAACRVASDANPAALDTATETCRSCRMPVSDPRLAAQFLQPGEEAVFFDDIGCLRDFLKDLRRLPGSVAWVAVCMIIVAPMSSVSPLKWLPSSGMLVLPKLKSTSGTERSLIHSANGAWRNSITLTSTE